MSKGASRLAIRLCELEDDQGLGIQESLLGDYITINRRLRTTFDEVSGLICRSEKDSRCYVVDEKTRGAVEDWLRSKELKSERWIKLAEKMGVEK